MTRLTCTRIGVAFIVLAALLLAGAATMQAVAANPSPTSYEPGHRRWAALHVIPSSDGTGVTVVAGRVGNLTTPIHSTLNVGGTSYEPGHTSYEPGHTGSEGGQWIFTFEGVAEGRTSPEMTAVVTTTEPTSGTVLLGSSTFERRYVPGDAATELTTLDNMVRLQIPAGALPPDSYIVALDTFAPPGDPPAGHRLLGQAYAIRASGALTASLMPMLLTMDYEAAALGVVDPRTVSIFEWDDATYRWQELASTPFGAETTHVKSISRFGAYALMAGTTWRDPFRNYDAVAAREHVRLVSGGRITLANGENEGAIVSVPITPTGKFAQWGELHYTVETPPGTSLTIDVLAEDNTLLLGDLPEGASLASIDPTLHPSVRLRATLRRTQPDEAPFLDEWAISWCPKMAPGYASRIYLPLITADGSAQATSANRVAASYVQTPSAAPPWRQAGLTGYSIDSLSIASDDMNVAYAATGDKMWGTYKTTDGGTHWTEVWGRWPSYAVTTDPQRPQTVYAGTLYDIWKTVNGGVTWTQIVDLGVDETHVLRVSKGDSLRVYAGTANYTGTGAGGVLRSTNGGATWQRSLPLHNVYDLALHPTDPALLFAAARDSSWNAGGVFQSTDGAISWTKVYTYSRVSAVVVDPFDGNIVYAGTDGNGVIKSVDAGHTWQSSNEGLAYPIVKALVADPVHRGVIFAGTWEGGVYRSNDGAMSWEPFSTGLDATFIQSLAIDIQGRTLYAGTRDNGVYRREVLPPPPRPGSTYATVVDGNQQPVEGATVFKNGLPVTDTLGAPAVTDAAGNLILPDAQPGDRLVAMQLLHEEPTFRQEHDGWAYRVYRTNLNIAADSSVTGHVIAVSGQQTLTVSSPLVLFNLLISLQWNATPEYLAELSRAAQLASDYLYDVSDGTMAFGQVAIYDNAQYWTEADIQVLVRNNVRPYAYIGGLVSADTADVIRVGRQWDRYAGPGAWDQPDGYRTLIHEFGHYALHLYDSYFKYEYDSGTGYLIGVTDAGIGCTRFHDDYTDGDAPISASIMNWQYATTELSDRRVSALWEAGQCEDTVQWQMTGQSDWETLEAHYRDPANPPTWQITRPVGNQLLAGPTQLSPDLLALPWITLYGDDRLAPMRQLLVLGPDGQPYAAGALVALDTWRRGRQVSIDQGITAVAPAAVAGQIAIYGASIGDTVRAVSLDGARSAQTIIGTNLDITLQFESNLAAGAATAPLNPYAVLIPGTDVHDLTLIVQGAGTDAGFSALVVPPGGGLGQTVELSPDSGGEVYMGTATFPVLSAGLGSLNLRGVGGLGQQVMLDSDFNLAPVNLTSEQDFYSPDGKAWWHLDEESFTAENTQLLLMPTGAVPLPLPTGVRPVGNAYSVRASGILTQTLHAGVLRLHYDPAAVDPGVAATQLRLARWDGAAWQMLPSESDPERFSVAAETDLLGIYALLAPTEAEERRVYLPLLLR